MAAAKRYSAEQIVAKLREHEKLQGQGLTIPGISDLTFYRSRLKYGVLKEDEAYGLKALEQENGRALGSLGQRLTQVAITRMSGSKKLVQCGVSL